MTLPFSTQIDYEYADLILDAGLNMQQSNRLILLLHKVAQGERFTIKTHSEVQKLWKEASGKLAEVSFIKYISTIQRVMSTCIV